MTSISRNLDVAEERARARAARRRTRPLAQPDTHELPAWTFRFLHTVH